jgi:hypothetical protein
MWGSYCIFKENKVKVFIPRTDKEEASENLKEIVSSFENVFNEDVSFDLSNLMDKDINHISLLDLSVITTLLNNVYTMSSVFYIKVFLLVFLLSEQFDETPIFISEDDGNSGFYKDFTYYG